MAETTARVRETTVQGVPERLRLTCREAWDILRGEASRALAREPLLGNFLRGAVLDHDGLGAALAGMLAQKLADAAVDVAALSTLAGEAMAADGTILAAACADLIAIYERDPAADDLITPFLYFKGYHALQWHRVAHWLWRRGRRDMAHYLQSRVSEAFAVDIHPAVPVGKGVFIDHGTAVVVGETAVIGDDVSILQGVTLGGTGKETGDRHPKVRDGVLLAAGAKVLGNIEIGRNAKVGAGSVVLKDVPPCATVVGVPARIVGWCADETPALSMDQSIAADVR